MADDASGGITRTVVGGPFDLAVVIRNDCVSLQKQTSSRDAGIDATSPLHQDHAAVEWAGTVIMPHSECTL